MTRVALVVLIASVGVSALSGIWALMFGDFGEIEVRVLMTSLCVSGASVLAMTSGAAMGRDRGLVFARIGLLASLAGFGAFVLGIWTWIEAVGFWKAATSLVIVGVWAAHASLLSLARLAPRYLWIRATTIACAAMLALLLLERLWTESNSEATWRTMGVLAILVSAGSILVPVLQRLSRRAEGDLLLGERCPHCGAVMPESIPPVFD